MRVISKVAYVAQANTPETDLQSTVMHRVEGKDECGQRLIINLMAAAPDDALNRANFIDSEYWKLFQE